MIPLRLGVGLWLLLTAARLAAHPMPNSLVFLTIRPDTIGFEVRVPAQELETAFGPGYALFLQSPVNEALRRYVVQHFRVLAAGDTATALLQQVTRESANDVNIGQYEEIILTGIIPCRTNQPDISLLYDLVIHQVVTHQALISIRQHWAGGIIAGSRQVAVAALDIPSGRILPVPLHLKAGSNWLGMKAMFLLGMRHIAEGTDHLLFLLVLLLPAPLLADGRRWGPAVGIQSSLRMLIRIITAFTLGHSLTLLLGSLHWSPFPAQWVEVCIAGSILVSAVHALYPVFFRREVYVAAGFGLVHGLAFSETLTQLRLSPVELGLSLAGFNLGIEAMQLMIMAVVLPGLLLLSRRPQIYQWVRIGGACMGMVAAIGWLAERISGTPNTVSHLLALVGQ